MKKGTEASVGFYLRRFRKSKNITQARLAEILGVSLKTISAWELGTRKLPSDAMIKLLRYYDISLRDFYRTGDSHQADCCIYVCKKCGNIIFTSADAKVSCCGMTLHAGEANTISECPEILPSVSDGRLTVRAEHEMTPDHCIMFIVYISACASELVKLYPGDRPEASFTWRGSGKILIGCSLHGLHTLQIAQTCPP
ncbi:MAG: helix-turn-helix domain-containing protein [Clostridia bacterium]|nr:helix-turn-helix domain-containing protein [Clostridia bacterium]